TDFSPFKLFNARLWRVDNCARAEARCSPEMHEHKSQTRDRPPSAMPPGPAVSQWSGPAREQAVQRMFTAIARFYDLNNSLLSFGLHHNWKRITASRVPAVDAGRALDIGAGTGDLALLIAPRMGNGGRVAAADLNAAMLQEGQRKIAVRGLTRQIVCLRANAEQLGFQNDTFDAVTTGFCMRN